MTYFYAPNRRSRTTLFLAFAAALVVTPATLDAQTASGGGGTTPPPAAKATATSAVSPELPPGYVIGHDDVLSVIFWREDDLTAEARVRPDGNISLPLLNDLPAAGLTPEALRVNVTEAARKFVADPTVSVVVKQINSRKIFITGQVAKPGAYPLGGPTTVLQLIALAGGVLEYADAESVVVMRTRDGRSVAYPFNYKDVIRRRNLQQNIELQPGDTVVVP